MLYVMPVPVGAVTVIVPVARLHVGCEVTEAVGTVGRATTVMVVADELASEQLEPLLTTARFAS